MEESYTKTVKCLKISVTDAYNLKYKYCDSLTSKEDALSCEEIQIIAEAAAELGIEKIRIAGGEPLLREDIITLVKKVANVKGIKELSMTTNGTLLKKHAQNLKKAGLGSVTICLDTLFENKYKEITCGGQIDDVMEGMDAAMEAGLNPIKLNTVIIKGFNDDEIMNFVQLTLNEAFYIHFIECMFAEKLKHEGQYEFISNKEICQQLQDIKPAQSENTIIPYYQYPGALGKIGFISPVSKFNYDESDRIYLTADGRLKPTYDSNKKLDLKPALKQKDTVLIKEKIEKIMRYK